MKVLVYSILSALLLVCVSCKKDKDTTQPAPVNNNPFEGGKGGDYSRAFFSGHNGTPVAARMYLKYGDNKMPADTTKFDEKYNAVKEPGFGYHAHFEHLTKGTYYFYAVSGTMEMDTVIVLTDSSELSKDIIIDVR